MASVEASEEIVYEDFDSRLYSADRGIVAEFVQSLLVADFLRTEQGIDAHCDAERSPNFPAFGFGSRDKRISLFA